MRTELRSSCRQMMQLCEHTRRGETLQAASRRFRPEKVQGRVFTAAEGMYTAMAVREETETRGGGLLGTLKVQDMDYRMNTEEGSLPSPHATSVWYADAIQQNPASHTQMHAPVASPRITMSFLQTNGGRPQSRK